MKSRTFDQFIGKVIMQLCHKSLRVGGWVKAFAQTNAISNWHGCFFKQWPAFAQVLRICFDQYRLYGYLAFVGDDANAAAKNINGVLRGASAFWEQQQMAAILKIFALCIMPRKGSLPM